MFAGPPADAALTETDYQVVGDEAAARQLLARLSGEKWVGLELAATSQTGINARVVGLAFSTGDGHGWYVPAAGPDDDASLVNAWRSLLENEQVGKVGFNLKYATLVLANYGVCLKGELFDPMLAHYVIQPEQRHQLEYLADGYLHCDCMSLADYFGTRWRDVRNMADLPV